MKQNNPLQEVRFTSHRQVHFKDGMIVTAEHLQDATNYPLDVFKTLIRAYFGCGIVCGLQVKASGEENQKTWRIEIHPGVALDCDGHPIELCKSVKFDLKVPCGCEPKPPERVCVVIGRCVEEKSASSNSDCSTNGRGNDCKNTHDKVIVKVFNSEDQKDCPTNICMNNPQEVSSDYIRPEYCDCMKKCPDKVCCGNSWVLLGCVQLDACGVVCIDNHLRKYVKPIQCGCLPEKNDCIDGPEMKESEKPPKNSGCDKSTGTKEGGSSECI